MVITIPDLTEEERQAMKRKHRQEAETQYRAWLKEAEALKEVYPTFSLDALLQDEEAVRQLAAGVSLARVFLATVAAAGGISVSHFKGYDSNDTMRLLAKNSLYVLVAHQGKYKAGFDEILEAYKPAGRVFDAMLDAFSYGFICGKREERSRRKVIS